MWAPCPPCEAAFRFLSALFGDEGADAPVSRPGAETAVQRSPVDRAVRLHPFQEAGVRRLRAILARHGGAVLADAVGLGKTFTALALIEERIRAGGDAVVVTPAALRRHWRNALSRVGRGDRPEWRLLSHTQLARGAVVAPPVGGRLIVVDEAHRFRNPGTLRYRALTRIVEAAASRPGPGQLLLVTATPVNNSVRDLYQLLRLFLPDGGLSEVGVPSLRAVFEPVPDPRAIQAVVREMVVRRGRRMADDRFRGIALGWDPREDAGRPFPRRAPPVLHRYTDPGIPGRVSSIEALELDAYGAGAGSLVRLSLLKRMDSSTAAFRTSLRRLRESLAAVLDAAVAGQVLRPGRHRPSGDTDPFQLVMVGLVADPAPPDLDLNAWIESARRDLRRVDGLLARSGVGSRDRGLSRGPDTADAEQAAPKTELLRALLRDLRGERVLVFTEYRDTAAFLWGALLRDRRVGRIDGSGAWLGSSPAGRRHVVERFAPRANHRPPPLHRERVDVLVATDVLAEGLNLQDARHVVSYDLPWNPVRLIQRIGRIDRLGSPHDVVVPHLFLPTEGLDRVLGLTRRLRTKLYGIATALGGAQADELLAGLVAGSPARVADVLDRVERREDLDPWERLRTLWVRSDGFGIGPASGDRGPSGPAADSGSANLADSVRWTASVPASGADSDRAPTPGVAWYSEVAAELVPEANLDALVLVRSGARDRARLIELSTDGRAGPITAAGANLLEALSRDDDPGLTEPDGPDPARLERIRRRVRDRLAAEAARAQGPTPLPAAAVGARLAGHVRDAMARAGSGLPPRTVRMADELLRALATPLTPAREEAAARLLAELREPGPGEPDRPVGQVVSAAHEAVVAPRPADHDLEPPTAPRRSCRSRPAEPAVEGVLLVTAETG